MKKILNLLTLLIIFFSFYLNLNAISNISINNNNLVPEFNNNTKVYNVFVKEDVEQSKAYKQQALLLIEKNNLKNNPLLNEAESNDFDHHLLTEFFHHDI